MKVQEKVARAKEAIRFISTHDDEPMEQIIKALNEVTDFIAAEKNAIEKRRAKQDTEKVKE